MKKLLAYINSLPKEARDSFAIKCKTTIGYLRKAISAGEMLRSDLCMRIDRESNRIVTAEELRPDLSDEFAHIRNTTPQESAG